MSPASLLRRLLADHPAIASFRWQLGATPGSTPIFLLAVVSAYLSTTLFLRRRLPPLSPPPPQPPLLRAVSAAHNVVLLLLSAVMAAGCAASALAAAPLPRFLFCFPKAIDPAGPTFFWAYVFYLSKIYELGDTLLIIVSRRPLTFLHVYHHAVVVVMCYVWLWTRQSLMPIALVTNAGVHVVMYSYYLSCSLGLRWPPRWKRAVTELQIAQFLFSFAVSGVFLYYHFAAGGCEGMGGWLFNAVFNASLLALFFNFHTGAYKSGKARKGRRED